MLSSEAIPGTDTRNKFMEPGFRSGPETDTQNRLRKVYNRNCLLKIYTRIRFRELIPKPAPQSTYIPKTSCGKYIPGNGTWNRSQKPVPQSIHPKPPPDPFPGINTQTGSAKYIHTGNRLRKVYSRNRFLEQIPKIGSAKYTSETASGKYTPGSVSWN